MLTVIHENKLKDQLGGIHLKDKKTMASKRQEWKTMIAADVPNEQHGYISV